MVAMTFMSQFHSFIHCESTYFWDKKLRQQKYIALQNDNYPLSMIKVNNAPNVFSNGMVILYWILINYVYVSK